jgi:hypothetical protein
MEVKQMVLLDRTVGVPYPISAMLERYSQSHGFGPAGLVATILVLVLPLCFIGGTMAHQDSCQDLGSPPGLCSKAATHADHLLAVPAAPFSLASAHETSDLVTVYVGPAPPSLGLLSIPDGRAPPLV